MGKSERPPILDSSWTLLLMAKFLRLSIVSLSWTVALTRISDLIDLASPVSLRLLVEALFCLEKLKRYKNLCAICGRSYFSLNLFFLSTGLVPLEMKLGTGISEKEVICANSWTLLALTNSARSLCTEGSSTLARTMTSDFKALGKVA